MGPIPFKRIVSVSSEDAVSPAKNLLFPATGKKWLCAANEKTRKAEIEFELCKKTRIAELEIGNVGSAFVEILVGCSDTEGNCTDVVTLLPQSAMMSAKDSKAGRNKSRTARFTKERLSATAAVQKWNRVRVVCRQPFNLTDQFGLSHIVIFSQAVASNELSIQSAPNTPSISSRSLAFGSPSSPASTSSAVLSPSTPNHSAPILTPHDLNNSAHSSQSLKVHSKSEPHGQNPVTPKRPVARSQTSSPSTVKTSRRAVRDGSPLSEFTGVEAQSRLLHNALRGIPHNDLEKETNPILLRIMAEREKYRTPPPVPRPRTPERRKVLDKELPKSQLKTDFAISYQTTSDSAELRRALARMAAHDNVCEMGEEPEFVWGKNGRKKLRKSGPSTGGSEWLTKRKDMVPAVTSAIMQPCVEVPIQVQPDAFARHDEAQLNKDGFPLTHEGCVEVALNRDGSYKDNGGHHVMIPPSMAESIHVPILTPPLVHDTEEMMPCPLCGIVLPQSALIIHAGSCVGTSDTLQSLVQVPIQVQPDAFARSNEAQLNNDGIVSAQQGCVEVALFNRDGCNDDHGGHHVSPLTAEGIHVHVGNPPSVPISEPRLDTEETMPCPLCGIVLPQSALIIHAGSCVGTSDTLQSLVQVPIQMQPDAFARKNDTQLNNDGILLTQQGCVDMALFNRDGCNEDHGGHHVHDTEEMMPCPLCGIVLPQYALITHAGSCGDITLID